MKRSGPLARRTELRRGPGPARRARLQRGPGPVRRVEVRKVNGPNLRKRRARQEGARAEKARRSPCAVCLALVGDLERFEFETADHSNVAGHVVKTRGAGGTDADTMPMCQEHEDAFHSEGIDSLGERLGVDLRELHDQFTAQIEGRA